MKDLAGKKIAILATDGFEQSELLMPLEKLKAAHGAVDVISIKSGKHPGLGPRSLGQIGRGGQDRGRREAGRLRSSGATWWALESRQAAYR